MNKNMQPQQLRLTTMIFYSGNGEPAEPIDCLEFKDSGFVMAKPNEDSKEWVRQVQIAFAEKDHNYLNRLWRNPPPQMKSYIDNAPCISK